jgi:hypothetical protein
LGNDDHRNATAQRCEANGVCALCESDRLGLSERREAEALAQEREDEALCDHVCIGVAGSPGREVAPVGLRDSPVATDLVAKVEAPGDAVIRLALPTGRELAARDSQSGESSPPSIESPSKAS